MDISKEQKAERQQDNGLQDNGLQDNRLRDYKRTKNKARTAKKKRSLLAAFVFESLVSPEEIQKNQPNNGNHCEKDPKNSHTIISLPAK